MMNADDVLPAARPLDVYPIDQADGERMFALQDQTQLATQGVALSLPGYFVVAQLDGERTVGELRAAFVRQFGQSISVEQIEALIAQLDEHYLLHTPRFEQRLAEARAAYAAAEAHDNRARWPAGEIVRAEIDLALAEGATDGDTPADVALRGVIAPHLDYPRGAPCYGAAYRALRAAGRAERYVILGTNHAGWSTSAVATDKDFVTPLGRVATDREFLDAWEAELGVGLREHAFDHAHEHSVELQVHVLQALWGDGFEIVPVLCPDPSGPCGTKPMDGIGPDLGDFADALGKLIARNEKRTLVIAGADLSHVGQRFGEQEPTDSAFLEQVRGSDTRLLALLERAEAREAAFVDAVREQENETRICSVGCIYTMMRALPSARCEVLKYHQAIDFEQETHVTCAAAVLRDERGSA